jgi:carboxynorspermidine decarboxylase
MFGSRSFDPLRRTLASVEAALGAWLPRFQWINLGGGYVVDDMEGAEQLGDIAGQLKRRYGLEVFFEPGKGVVGAAGELIATVVDLFESDGERVAVLDTTVNHLPGVFEYQTMPAIREATNDGAFTYLIAGSSCLAGDLLGKFRFAAPLTIGSRLSFIDVGAYMLVKASRFNGINLPAVYGYSEAQGLSLIKEYDYDDYRSYWT